MLSVVSFIVIQAPPGDYMTSYITQMQASGNPLRQEEVETLRRMYGLDQPMYMQYLKWMWRIVRYGEFGMSFNYHRPVMAVIGDRLGLSLVVSISALILTYAVGVLVGVYSAVHQYSVFDYLFTFIAFFGQGVPGFMVALVVLYVAYRWFGISVGGLFSAEYAIAPWSWARLVDLLKHLPLPALILGLSATGSTMRVMRANLLDELRKPYVETATAKGVPYSKVLWKYPVRVAINPFISLLGPTLMNVVSGSVMVAMVMGLPTMGPLLYQSLIAQDMYVAGTIVLLFGITCIIGTLISDILLALLDPRIRLETR